MSEELVAWLRAALDDDEASEWPHRPSCQMLKPVPPGWGGPMLGDSFSCNCDAASRWIAEVGAKRRIIDEAVETLGREDAWDPVLNGGSGEEYDWARFVLRMIALPYADRDGFRPEWAA